jgi:hypothetical protein
MRSFYTLVAMIGCAISYGFCSEPPNDANYANKALSELNSFAPAGRGGRFAGTLG